MENSTCYSRYGVREEGMGDPLETFENKPTHIQYSLLFQRQYIRKKLIYQNTVYKSTVQKYLVYLISDF